MTTTAEKITLKNGLVFTEKTGGTMTVESMNIPKQEVTMNHSEHGLKVFPTSEVNDLIKDFEEDPENSSIEKIEHPDDVVEESNETSNDPAADNSETTSSDENTSGDASEEVSNETSEEKTEEIKFKLSDNSVSTVIEMNNEEVEHQNSEGGKQTWKRSEYDTLLKEGKITLLK